MRKYQKVEYKGKTYYFDGSNWLNASFVLVSVKLSRELTTVFKDQIELEINSPKSIDKERVKNTNVEYIDNYLDIKKILKSVYNLDIVLIQSGPFFEALEEDAIFMEHKYNWTPHERKVGQYEYKICSAPSTKIIEKFLYRELNNSGLDYAILKLISDPEEIAERDIAYTSNNEILGLKFIYKNKNN